ncbi:MAG: ASCH domain-containing protein [Ignisphaera sp.]
MKKFVRRYIMIKGKFARLILTGKKTTTIRLGRVVPKSSEVIIHSNGRPIAEAKIKNIIYKKVKELKEEDAIRDGYSSLQELLSDLRNIYKVDINPDDEVTIIEFEVTKKFDDIDISDIYLGFSPHTIAVLANRYLRDVMSKDERNVVEHMLRYKSIRLSTIKMFGSLNKRWIIRNTLRSLLIKLIVKGIIAIDQEILEKLATISSFWRRYLVEKSKASSPYRHQQHVK